MGVPNKTLAFAAVAGVGALMVGMAVALPVLPALLLAGGAAGTAALLAGGTNERMKKSHATDTQTAPRSPTESARDNAVEPPAQQTADPAIAPSQPEAPAQEPSLAQSSATSVSHTLPRNRSPVERGTAAARA